MGLREKLNESRGMGAGIALAMLVLAVVLVVYELHPVAAPPARDAYFYDLGSRQLVKADETLAPPIPAPSGGTNEAVRVFIYSCGDCANASTWKTAYLRKYTPEAKAAMAKEQIPENQTVVEQGLLVAGMDGKNWVKADSRAGRAIMDERSLCGTPTNLRICDPGE